MATSYQIITDSSCDLPQELADRYGLIVLPLSLTVDDKTYHNYLDGREIGFHELYEKFRSGSKTSTCAVNPEAFIQVMEPCLREGHDVFYIGFSSGLSTTYQSGVIAAAELREKYPELPYFLMGHSMGSFIAREFAAAYGNSLTAVVFMGTSAGISTAMWKAERTYLNMLKKAKGARAKIPSLEKIATGPYNKKFKPNRTNYDWVTSKEEEVDRFVNDPLCGFPLTVQGYIDLGTLLYAINTDQWYRRVPKDLPILLISGENDPVGDMGKGVRRVFDKLNKTGHDVKLTLYPRIRHALITEMNSAQVYEDLYAFFSSHLPKAEEPVYEKETEAEPKVSTETEKSVENPAAEEEKETKAAAAEKYDDMPEENAELPVI